MKRETTAVIVIALALTTLGVLMIYSASAVSGDSTGLLKRQLVMVGVGLVAMIIGVRFDYRRFSDPPIFRLIVVAAGALLLMVLVPGIGVKIDGARRWIQIAGFRFQPSEYAKFAMIVLLAVKLTENHEHVQKFWRGFLPPMVIASAFSLLVLLERDLGVPAMLMGVAVLMLFVAGVRWRFILVGFVGICGAVGALIYAAPHRFERLVAFLHPWEYREGAGWQLIQSMSGFAQGALLGRGVGASEQKLGYLPAAHTDFIFSVIGEEMGLVGTLTVVGLFALLAWYGFRIASRAPDLFGVLLATGISGLIIMQGVFVMAVTTGLLPTKGLPLPFISYGGTSLIVFLGLVGVLVNIGVQAHEPETLRKLTPAAPGGARA
jgi:cell division protein FtsW